MKKSLYIYEFEKFVGRFIDDQKLLTFGNGPQKISVAFSGGVDSVALAEVLVSQGFRPHLIYINHGTRGMAHKWEEKTTETFAKKYQLSFSIHRLKLDLNMANFEQVARRFRQDIFSNWAKRENGLVCTGHHLDDSFEWSLMQSLKQGDWQKTLGIPVKSGHLRRPFLCVSKSQIQKYARAKKLYYRVDQSNFNIRYERNFLREKVISAYKEKYPQYLKHYVERSRELAKISAKLQAEKRDRGPWFTRFEYGSELWAKPFDLLMAKEELLNAIITEVQFYSQNDRGKLRGPIEKLLIKLEEDEKLRQNGKAPFPFLGPWSFTGGVLVFIVGRAIMITHQKKCEEFFFNMDQEYFNNMKKAQIPFGESSNTFPYLVLVKKNDKSSKYIHPLLPKTCRYLRDHEIPYTYLPIVIKSEAKDDL